MRLVNLTPHPITILGADGEKVREILPSGQGSPRAEEKHKFILEAEGVQVTQKEWGTVNLPEPQEDVLYIVSAVIAQAARERKDLIVPNTIREQGTGRILGCRSFSFVS